MSDLLLEGTALSENAVEGRREREKRELRARIYETARQLFLEHGLVDPGYPLEERLLQTAAFIREAIQARTESG